jgi:arylsulfatase
LRAKRPYLRGLLALVASIAPALFLALSCGDAAPRGPARRVVLITCDTLRADRLGLYGCERPISPNLDAFAREGVVYEEAYATSSMTQPALSSLLTGRYPGEIGCVPGNARILPSEVETLAERLVQERIDTAAVVSNWVLRRVGAEAGDVGVQQGFAHFDDSMSRRERNRPVFERTAGDTTDAAIAWLEAGARESHPFFLWVHYQDPHGPYTPPPDIAASLAQEPSPETEQLPFAESSSGQGAIPRYQRLGAERGASVYRQRYEAEVAYFDREVGRLLDHLRSRGLYQDALIVFSADHGESLGEHDYWFCHGENLYREVVRVPLVVRFPAGSAELPAPGPDGYRRQKRIAGHLDLFPTVLEALGLPPAPSRGLSLFAAELPDERTLAHVLECPPEKGIPRWWAASDGRYRVVWNEVDGKYRLFDIRRDPEERSDIADSDRDRIRRMLEDWKEIADNPLGVAVEGSSLELSEETLEALEHLGYVEGESGGSD